MILLFIIDNNQNEIFFLKCKIHRLINADGKIYVEGGSEYP